MIDKRQIKRPLHKSGLFLFCVILIENRRSFHLNIKRFISVIIVLAASFAIFGCSDNKTEETTSVTTSETTTVTTVTDLSLDIL